MTLPERLELAWETLEAGGTREPLVRSIRDLGIDAHAVLGIDSNGAREILFRLPREASVAAPPPVKGVRVLVRTVTVGTVADRFLVVRCDWPSAYRVFARFAADVLEQTANAGDIVRVVLDVLATWREMFRRDPTDSESMARGLFGELDELRRLSAIDPSAVDAWRGPTNEPQDFIRGRYALEVKSTRTRARFVEIHGLLQLWARPFDSLVMAVKHVATDASGETVSDAIRALVAQRVDATRLQDLLEQVGFSEGADSSSALRFTVRDTRYFRITDSAPALTPDSLAMPSLPTGVSQLTYVLALDADGLVPCSAAELEESTRGLLVGPT